jgi:ABC-2 type transport system permease protein
MSTEASHTTGSSSTTLQPRPGTAFSRFLSDGYVTTWRNVKKLTRVPDILIFTLIQPIMFVLLFTFVFGSSIQVPGESYTSFLMAGIFAQTIVFGSTYSGSAMAQDLKDGIIDRFRTLPMSGSAVLVGRTVGDLVINVLSLIVMMLTGLLVGLSLIHI